MANAGGSGGLFGRRRGDDSGAAPSSRDLLRVRDEMDREVSSNRTTIHAIRRSIADALEATEAELREIREILKTRPERPEFDRVRDGYDALAAHVAKFQDKHSKELTAQAKRSDTGLTTLADALKGHASKEQAARERGHATIVDRLDEQDATLADLQKTLAAQGATAQKTRATADEAHGRLDELTRTTDLDRRTLDDVQGALSGLDADAARKSDVTAMEARTGEAMEARLANMKEAFGSDLDARQGQMAEEWDRKLFAARAELAEEGKRLARDLDTAQGLSMAKLQDEADHKQTRFEKMTEKAQTALQKQAARLEKDLTRHLRKAEKAQAKRDEHIDRRFKSAEAAANKSLQAQDAEQAKRLEAAVAETRQRLDGRMDGMAKELRQAIGDDLLGQVDARLTAQNEARSKADARQQETFEHAMEGQRKALADGDAALQAQGAKVEAARAAVEGAAAEVEKRLSAHEKRVILVEERLAGIHQRVDPLEAHVSSVDAEAMQGVQARLATMQEEVGQAVAALDDVKRSGELDRQSLDGLQGRMDALDANIRASTVAGGGPEDAVRARHEMMAEFIQDTDERLLALEAGKEPVAPSEATARRGLDASTRGRLLMTGGLLAIALFAVLAVGFGGGLGILWACLVVALLAAAVVVGYRSVTGRPPDPVTKRP